MSGRFVAAAALAAGAGRVISGLLPAASPGRGARWERENHRGEPVTLLEGPAVALAAAAGALLAPSGRARAAGAFAALGAAAFGALDDLAGDGQERGLRGHGQALARGRMTTGAIKMAGVGALGIGVGAILATERDTPTGWSRRADVLVSGGVVAASANLANLLDLRPGRTLKAVLSVAPLLSASADASASAGAVAGAALAALPGDLHEQSMLGDTGANSVGALLGTAAISALGRRGRLLALAVLSALTAASEKVSFTQVIARTPVLRQLDAAGRRPA